MGSIPSDEPHQHDTRNQALEEPLRTSLWASRDEEEASPGTWAVTSSPLLTEGSVCDDGGCGVRRLPRSAWYMHRRRV